MTLPHQHYAHRYALWVSYDGGLFSGFQRLLPRAEQLPTGGSPDPRRWPRQATVQEELEAKLQPLLGEAVTVWPSGRTDAGVHASGQVCMVLSNTAAEPGTLRRKLNALLDAGVQVSRVERARPEFHPRFSATERCYRYLLVPGCAGYRSPFSARYAWHLDDPLDLDAMRRAAEPLLGSHDFSAFARRSDDEGSRRRRLERVELGPTDLPWGEALLALEIQGNAFLRRMVRLMVAALVQVGRGRWPESRPGELLAGRDATRGAAAAPPHGLFLVRVDYPDSCWLEAGD